MKEIKVEVQFSKDVSKKYTEAILKVVKRRDRGSRNE